MKEKLVWCQFALGFLFLCLGMQVSATMSNVNSNKDICAGRYVISLPSSSSINMDVSYHGIRVEKNRKYSSFSDIEDSVKHRSDKYKSVATERNDGDDQFLKAAGLDPDKVLSDTQLVGKQINSTKEQAIIGYHTQPSGLDVTVELHAFIEGHGWVFTLNNTGAGDFAHDSAVLTDAANRFRPISKQATKLAGFCVMGGVFTDSAKPEIGEDMTLVVNDPSHKDMDLTVESSDFSKPSRESFSEEVDQDLAILKDQVHDLKVLDRGVRVAAGQEGHLVAITGTDPDLDGVRFYKYYWSAAGVPNNVMKPSLSVELVTHAANASEESFKDADDVADYFDRILDGIHERLGAR